MDTYSTCQLGNTGNRQFYLFAGSHDQITELIDNNHNIRHKFMAFFGIQPTIDKLFVIFLYVPDMRHLEQIITSVHLHADRIQCLYHFSHIRYDSIFSIRQFSQKVMLDYGIYTELHLLRID